MKINTPANFFPSIDSYKPIIEDPICLLDFISMIVGPKIANGAERHVFNLNTDWNKVIKISPYDTRQNLAEYFLYKKAIEDQGEFSWVKDWLAPIRYLSPSGHILVMDATDPKPKKKRPEKIPAFFNDVKWDNFGWIGNRFVCHDYGINKSVVFSKKQIKANW